MTLSTPVKIVALAALALLLGLGGVLMLSAKHAPAAISVPPIVHHVVQATVVSKAAPAKTKAVKPRVVLQPGLPSIVRLALERNANAVIVVYSSRVPADRAIRAEALAGAHLAHAAFVPADVANNGIAAGVASWSASIADPAVLVVRRPGRVVFGARGLTDRLTVAQAVRTAK
jgi:hypothetical protein